MKRGGDNFVAFTFAGDSTVQQLVKWTGLEWCKLA
jgi:hypothetical protein